MAEEIKMLERAFYERDTRIVAFELIGKMLTFEENGLLLSGRIVETEAYLGNQDPASHAYRGPTPRNRVMFGPPGTSYVYFTYGNHHCLNVVTEKEGRAGAVLIRAAEPLSGISTMMKRRGPVSKEALTNGPGKLTQAFGITRKHSGLEMVRPPLYITDSEDGKTVSQPPARIQAAKRIGISRAKEKLFRFYLAGNPFVSVK